MVSFRRWVTIVTIGSGQIRANQHIVILIVRLVVSWPRGSFCELIIVKTLLAAWSNQFRGTNRVSIKITYRQCGVGCAARPIDEPESR